MLLLKRLRFCRWRTSATAAVAVATEAVAAAAVVAAVAVVEWAAAAAQTAWHAFWYLHRIITRELFFRNWSSRHRGVKSASDPMAADNITRLFGTVMPSSVPESTAWWRNQQKELFALSDDSENGLMQTMLTVTLNDSSPELAVCIRRGPFAIPDEHGCQPLASQPSDLMPISL